MFEEKTLKLQTRCHKCIFAQFDKNVQTGCELGRSEKFRKQGKTERKVLENVDAYEISTACTTYRDAEWINENDEKIHNLGDAIGAVREVVRPQVDFVIVENSGDGLPTVKIKFERTINSVLDQDILPKSVIFVVNNDPVFKGIADIIKMVGDMLKGSGVDYKIVRNIEKPVEYFRLLDVGVGKCFGTYYTHYRLGMRLPHNIISVLDGAINDDLFTISYVVGEEWYDISVDGTERPRTQIVQRSLHKLLGGNEGAYIGDKIAKLAESQGVTNKMMFTWEQLDAKKLS